MQRLMNTIEFCCIGGLFFSATFGRAGEVHVHTLESPRQSAPTDVRVLLPDVLEEGRKYPAVYLLPVEPGRASKFGDSIAEVQKLDAANKFQVVCVAPSFAALPWYTNHPTDPQLAQEAYLLEDVLPLVEAKYPVLKEPRGRLLCGFSKSGWGAWSLLLRHPDVFGRAASWDAPLTMAAPGKYGSGPIFGDADNFSHYQITKLLDERAETLRVEPPRLILLGYGNFLDHRAIHEQLERLKIPHVYRDGPKTPHVWSTEWLEPALDALTK